MAGIEHNQAAGGTLWRDLLSFGVYKRNQGRIARQVTFAALAITLATGIWRLAQLLPAWFADTAAVGAADLGVLRFLVPGLLLAVGLWILFRLVNYPPFADFLIAVEAEMAKVSWPTADEVIRSSAVVIFLIFALAAILAAYDLFWWFVLRAIQGTR
ncbi:MAG: SecE protein [Planctomycetota bacterium]|jgi:preprotein translocase subunit SecE